jgi:hypothetical protein
MLTQRIGFGVLESVAPVYLIKSGMHRETLSKIASINFLSLMFLPCFIGKFISGRNLESLASVTATRLLVLDLIFFSYASYSFSVSPITTSIVLIGLSLFIFE